MTCLHYYLYKSQLLNILFYIYHIVYSDIFLKDTLGFISLLGFKLIIFN
jgi:hypothetical protein